MNDSWFEVALKVLGGISLFGGFFALFWKRERKAAGATISKTEAEKYKQIIENKLADLNLADIIEQKVAHHLKEFKDILWEAQEEHYKVKLDLQERHIKALKEKNEVEQENEILKNELSEMREQHESCLRQIAELRKEVNKLKNTKS